MIFTSYVQSSEDLEQEEGDELFVPTDEWQLIKPGQAVPAGLHIKFDMTNGGRWAKRLKKDEEDNVNNKNGIVVVGKPDGIESEEKTEAASYDIDELKAQLKKMKNDHKKANNDDGSNKEDTASKFRSMDQIREELSDMYLTQETDFEVMEKFVALLIRSGDDEESKVFALQELEYYVHQVDNANDFFLIDNAVNTVMLCLNSSNAEIRENAIHVIGSAVQSNPSAQVKAIKENVIPSLLRLLADPVETLKVKKKVIFALSSLLRNFPRAQIEVWKLGGYHTLMDVISRKDSHVLQLKIIRLFTDLVDERNNIDKLHVDYKERKRQYSIVPLHVILEKLEFCNEITSFLDPNAEFDVIETVLIALKTMKNICKYQGAFSNSFENGLSALEKFFTKKVSEEKEAGEEDGYFQDLLSLLKEVQRTYNFVQKPSLDTKLNDSNNIPFSEGSAKQASFENHKTEL